ncbi:MAG TPA: hypothetical protein VGI78_26005 [Acetobacteraceae bacterium]|jgi:hypothetical protein
MVTDATIDGMRVAEAVAECCRRHNELSSDEVKFLQRMTGRDAVKKGGGAVRLTGIVRRLRQLDLVAAAELMRSEG